MAEMYLPAALAFQRGAKPLQAGVIRIFLAQRRKGRLGQIQAIQIALRFDHATARLFLVRIQRQCQCIALQRCAGVPATEFDRGQCRLQLCIVGADGHTFAQQGVCVAIVVGRRVCGGQGDVCAEAIPVFITAAGTVAARPRRLRGREIFEQRHRQVEAFLLQQGIAQQQLRIEVVGIVLQGLPEHGFGLGRATQAHQRIADRRQYIGGNLDTFRLQRLVVGHHVAMALALVERDQAVDAQPRGFPRQCRR